MEATTSHRPSYGPQGQPYAVRVDGKTEWFWTEAEAWDARDAALDAGSMSVRVIGMPCRGLVAGL
jgi:hypothetical protein